MNLPAIPSEYIKGEEVPRGLSLHPEFLDGSGQESLLREVEGLSWDRSGYNPEHLGHFQFGPPSFRFRPRWARTLGNKLHQLGFFRDTPNSVFLFQYPSNTGIAFHTDQTEHYGDTIAGVSLGASCVMHFRRKNRQEITKLLLHPGSLYVMTGEARYAWEHGIPCETQSSFQGDTIERGPRISVTFRHYNWSLRERCHEAKRRLFSLMRMEDED